MVTGMAFCGMLIEFHCRRAISGIVGFGLRACTSEVSMTIRPESTPAT